jgi:hypothetical protein
MKKDGCLCAEQEEGVWRRGYACLFQASLNCPGLCSLAPPPRRRKLLWRRRKHLSLPTSASIYIFIYITAITNYVKSVRVLYVCIHFVFNIPELEYAQYVFLIQI